jgi:hypothetical protein
MVRFEVRLTISKGLKESVYIMASCESWLKVTELRVPVLALLGVYTKMEVNEGS